MACVLTPSASPPTAHPARPFPATACPRIVSASRAASSPSRRGDSCMRRCQPPPTATSAPPPRHSSRQLTTARCSNRHHRARPRTCTHSRTSPRAPPRHTPRHTPQHLPSAVLAVAVPRAHLSWMAVVPRRCVRTVLPAPLTAHSLRIWRAPPSYVACSLATPPNGRTHSAAHRGRGGAGGGGAAGLCCPPLTCAASCRRRPR